MNRGSGGAFLELDSYRLAQYAQPAPCFICGGGNAFDAETCRHCFAPMELARQVKSTRAEPLLLGTLGASGVGKTVYLGMLMDMLSRRKGELQLATRGGFSVNLQQATIDALSRGEFPSKTPSEPDRWNWVHCQATRSGRSLAVEMVMPDMAGESILEEVDRSSSIPVVHAFLKKCRGLTLLIDPTRLHAGYQEQDFYAMKLLNYLLELCDHPKRGWPNRPVALVFSKADECEDCFLSPAAFAENHAPGLWRLCQQRFRRHQFFAAGVAGATAFRETRHGRVRVPLRIEPRGIVEPFAWLMRQLAA